MRSRLRLILTVFAIMNLLMADLAPALAQSNWQQQQLQRQQQQQQWQRQQQEQAARRAREAQEAARRAQQEAARKAAQDAARRAAQESARREAAQRAAQAQRSAQEAARARSQKQYGQQRPQAGGAQTQTRMPRPTVSQLARNRSATTAQKPIITPKAQSAIKAKLAALKSKAANDNQRGGSGGKPPSRYGGSGSGGKPPSVLSAVFNKSASWQHITPSNRQRNQISSLLYKPIQAHHLLGQNYRKLGTVVENPKLRIKRIRWHYVDMKISRSVSTTDALRAIRQPYVVFQQSGGRYLYLTNKAAVVIDKDGELITTYGEQQFDQDIKEILSR